MNTKNNFKGSQLQKKNFRKKQILKTCTGISFMKISGVDRDFHLMKPDYEVLKHKNFTVFQFIILINEWLQLTDTSEQC